MQDAETGGPAAAQEKDGASLEGEEYREDEKGPNRRCVVTGTSRPAAEMVRFALSPDGEIVPDVEGRLPGRGIWLSASRDMVNTALGKKLFAKAARARVTAPPDLADRVEALLSRRCLNLLGMAKRAGQAVAGYEKVRAEALARRIGLLLAAKDAAEGGRAKVRAVAPDVPLVDLFDSAELGGALGRDNAVHVAVAPGKLSELLLQESARLAGFRHGACD